MANEIKVAIIEDQKPTREGLVTLINGTSGYRAMGSYAAMEEALRRWPGEPPDVALVDIGLRGMSGIEGVRQLKALQPSLQILMLTVYADHEHVFEAICAGACGYLLKDTPPMKLLEAVREAHHGGSPMSPEIARQVVTMFQRVIPPKTEADPLSGRELQVLKLIAEGYSYKMAGDELSVSLDTIRFHIRHIYEKLHVHSKSEAVLKALRSGLFS